MRFADFAKIKKTEELWKDGKSGISVENTRLARMKS